MREPSGPANSPFDGTTTGDCGYDLSPGTHVLIETDSPLYQGAYASEVIEVYESHVRLALPSQDGKLILLPAGTQILLHGGVTPGHKTFARTIKARVVDRKTGQDGGLLVAFEEWPGNIGKALRRPAKCVSVMSGKGGVGKTLLAINLAAGISRNGRKVILVDSDFESPNVAILLNQGPRDDLRTLLMGETGNVISALSEGPAGLQLLLSLPPENQAVRPLDQRESARLVLMLTELEDLCDLVVLDSGRGLSTAEGDFAAPVGKAIVVTTPEPHSVTDAYCLLRKIASQGEWTHIGLIVNMAETRAEAEAVATKMHFAARRFLNCELVYIGHLLADSLVKRSVREQVILVDRYPKSRVALCIMEMAERVQAEFM